MVARSLTGTLGRNRKAQLPGSLHLIRAPSTTLESSGEKGIARGAGMFTTLSKPAATTSRYRERTLRSATRKRWISNLNIELFVYFASHQNLDARACYS